MKYAAHPFGDQVWIDKDENPHHDFPLDKQFGQSAADHELWAELRKGRSGFADPAHPFLHQGSADLNTYKMFLETGHSLLGKGGRLGLLVPSGIYSDKGAGSLRRLFLKKSRWSHLYAFQNERFIFGAVHHSFKVAAINVEKGGVPNSLRTRFRLGPGDSPEAHELEGDIPNENGYLPVSMSEIEDFSPRSGAILEIRTPRDLEIVKKLYANGVLLGNKSPDGWNIRYATEFHMTNDSELFPPRWKWEDKGYRSDEYGHWLLGNWQPYAGAKNILQRPTGVILSADGAAAIQVNDIQGQALPLYQGVMIQQFDFSAKAWRSGTGARADWHSMDWESKRIEPQYLMSRGDFLEHGQPANRYRAGFRGIARTTDQRTLISATLPWMPCSDMLPMFVLPNSESQVALISGLNSYTCDWAQRVRQSGPRLNFFIVEELAVIRPFSAETQGPATRIAAGLSMAHTLFAREWLTLPESAVSRKVSWKQLWAVTPHERVRLRALLDAVVAELFCLSLRDFAWIMQDCDWPATWLLSKPNTRPLDPKGFWRVDKEKDPELRHSVLAQIAFHELKRSGLKEFLAMNGGEGWLLPETLRLDDYGLGHDDRAKDHQPVASALGPRFYPWQLEQSVDESWQECERHAEVLAKLLPPPDLEKITNGEGGDAVPVDLFGNPVETDLFGQPVYGKSRKR